jgi:carbonic anhydrase/acetyltransferase-like protein (isoleucine patch superfamily)
MILEYRGKRPRFHESVFIAPRADVIGDVTIGKDSGIWFRTVVRGDVNFIRIGERTNIQDGCLLHVTQETFPLVLGDGITVGHGVILHGCHVGSNTLIGIGSILLDGSEISENTIIGAGSLVTEGAKIPSGVLAFGRPAKPYRDLTDDEVEGIRRSAANYLEYKDIYKEQDRGKTG